MLDSYKNITIMAVPGLHAAVYEQITSIYKPELDKKSLKVLDFGCGAGAFTQRLLDNGFTVTAVDITRKNFSASSEATFKELNFNDEKAVGNFVKENQNSFDIVIGLEVIEHVENPWKYIRDLKTMLKDNGHLFISTPNITNWHSRFRFLLKGTYDDFNENSQYEHINPITPWEIKLILERSGLKLISFTTAGKIYGAYGRKSFLNYFVEFALKPLRIIQSGYLGGYCYLLSERSIKIERLACRCA
jgi:ubiquinone biosynthesis O-methyltransferase